MDVSPATALAIEGRAWSLAWFMYSSKCRCRHRYPACEDHSPHLTDSYLCTEFKEQTSLVFSVCLGEQPMGLCTRKAGALSLLQTYV